MIERAIKDFDFAEIGTIVMIALVLWAYLALMITCLWEEVYNWYQTTAGPREARAKAKRTARFDKCLKRAPSSTCVERLTLNQKVPGSNPGGLTKKKEYDVRRRISWFLDTRTAIAMSDGDVLPTKFQWRDLPRPSELIPGRGVMRRTRDFKPEEKKVQLLWDGTSCETFVDEVTLKRFIISLVYMIGNSELVPSELLADAKLVYKDDWVDEWGCQDRNDEIIECPREIYRPGDRKIQLDAGFTTRRSGQQNAKPRIYSKTGLTVIPARIEIPDEKCFYSFRAGGFYEKDQKPLEAACEKGEKEV